MQYNYRRGMQSNGGLVIMGAHVLCKHEVGVRSSHPPPCKEVRSLAPLVLVVKHRFCNPRSGVRFTPGAPPTYLV